MQIRLCAISAALIACSNSAGAVTLPTHETYSAAADIGSNFFTFDPLYTPLTNILTTPGVPVSIAGNNYTASASTALGSNRTYVQAGSFPYGVFGAAGFSGWYDQVKITGGTGTGTARFTVRLNGTVDVGAIAGEMGYVLGTSNIPPSQLASGLTSFNLLSKVQAWPLDAVTPITSYLLGVSPYTDASILFGAQDLPRNVGIPSIPDPNYQLGGTSVATAYDLVLAPGAGQAINLALHGTISFTYGEAFYLMSGMSALLADGLDPYCAFTISDACTPPLKDGTGSTTLDFSNSANLINITLPNGATANFASGASYNVTTVPEPGEWLMLLTGLVLVSWAARRRA